MICWKLHQMGISYLCLITQIWHQLILIYLKQVLFTTGHSLHYHLISLKISCSLNFNEEPYYIFSNKLWCKSLFRIINFPFQQNNYEISYHTIPLCVLRMTSWGCWAFVTSVATNGREQTPSLDCHFLYPSVEIIIKKNSYCEWWLRRRQNFW